MVEWQVVTIVSIHDTVIKTSGGASGIRDAGGLHHFAYEFLHLYATATVDQSCEMGAFIYSGLARNHYFFDGNKRTAFAFSKMHLLLRGSHLRVDYDNALPFLLQVADQSQHVPFSHIERWFTDHVEVYTVPEGSDRNSFILKLLLQTFKEMKSHNPTRTQP